MHTGAFLGSPGFGFGASAGSAGTPDAAAALGGGFGASDIYSEVYVAPEPMPAYVAALAPGPAPSVAPAPTPRLAYAPPAQRKQKRMLRERRARNVHYLNGADSAASAAATAAADTAAGFANPGSEKGGDRGSDVQSAGVALFDIYSQ